MEMRNEGHYIGIRRLEGHAAELRARAADRGETYEEKSTVDRLIEELAGVKDFAAVAQRRKEIADDKAKAKAEIAAGWADLDRERDAHAKSIAEHEVKVKSGHAALDARIGEIDRREVESRAREAKVAERERASIELQSRLENKRKRLEEVFSL
jgi:hypothetical protein